VGAQGDAGIALRIESLTFSNAHVSGNAHGTYVAAAGAGPIDLRRSSTAPTLAARALSAARALMGGGQSASGL
jgi:hypothetical protein